MGCTFCASTVGSKVRNLSSGEMLGQILSMSNDVGDRISNIVIMGSGEPFDNYENLLKFFDLIMSKDTLNIGARHITVSTCGLADKIIDFADRRLQVNLAISLHNANQDKRSQIMPISRKFGIQQLMKAIEYYILKTNRRVTYEYALISEVNDSEEDAKLLVKLVKNQLCHINLIPVNSTDHSNYKKPDNDRIQRFINILSKNGINATIRREMGTDINGACGQLRISAISKENL
jgi:23S rRNA m2A2503 methyltransferase